MGMRFLFVVITLINIGFNNLLNSQIGINNDGTNPDITSMLDVKSTSKGILIPRMSQADIEAISNPANGLLVFNTSDSKFYAYISVNDIWKELKIGIGTISPPVWSCGDPLIYDGQSYNTTQIGTQCWMAENLNVGTMINSNTDQSSGNGIEKYCFGNSAANCITYGGLYQWDEMMQYTTTGGTQGICPTDWHIATDAEFKTMEIQLGMSPAEADNSGFRGNNEGSKLSGNETLWWDGALDNNAEFGISGFDVLPGGFLGGDFYSMHERAYIWTSTQSSTSAWTRVLYFYDARSFRTNHSKDYGFSVRCLHD